MHGDPLSRIFQPVSPSSAFTSALWKCTGYVPKKLGFQFREFPGWDDEGDGGEDSVRVDGVGTASIGAGMLFALSKDCDAMKKGKNVVVLRSRDGGGAGNKERSRVRSHGAQTSRRHKDEKRERKRRKRKASHDARKRGESVDANGTVKSDARGDGNLQVQQEAVRVVMDGDNRWKTQCEDKVPICQTDANLGVGGAGRGDAPRVKKPLVVVESSGLRIGKDSPVNLPVKTEIVEPMIAEALSVDSKSTKVEINVKAPDRVELDMVKHQLEGDGVGVLCTGTSVKAESADPVVCSQQLAHTSLCSSVPSEICSVNLIINEAVLVKADEDAHCGKGAAGSFPNARVASKPHHGHSQLTLPSHTLDSPLDDGVKHFRCSDLKSKDVKSESDYQISEKVLEVPDSSFNENGTKELTENPGSCLIERRSSFEQRHCSEADAIANCEPHKQTNPILDVPIALPPNTSCSNSLETSDPQSLVPSASGRTDNLVQREDVVVSSSVGKSGSSVEASQGYSRRQVKCQPKSSIRSAHELPESSKSIYSRHRLSSSKEQISKSVNSRESERRSSDGDISTLQSRNKMMPPNFIPKKDKSNRQDLPPRQDIAPHSVPMDLPSTDAAVSLSDEQLALLLHQQLNSSPRVPRVPRVHQGGVVSAHSNAASVFSKRSFPAGGRDQPSILKKKHKDDSTRYRSRCSGSGDETRRQGKVSSSDKNFEQVNKCERLHAKESLPRLANSTGSKPPKVALSSSEVSGNSSPLETSGAVHHGLRNNLTEDESNVSIKLQEFIGQIISKNGEVTYVELCDAVYQNWSDLIKLNSEQHSYASHIEAVNDCLRGKSEWAHLIDQAHKSSNKKQRKVDDGSMVWTTSAKYTKRRFEIEETSSDSEHSDYQIRKQKTSKRRRLQIQGRRVADARRVLSDESDSDEETATSNSSRDEDDSLLVEYKSKASKIVDSKTGPSTGHFSDSSSSSAAD